MKRRATILDSSRVAVGFNFNVGQREESSNFTESNEFNEMTKSEQKQMLSELKN